MDKHRGGDRYNSTSVDPHHYNSSDRHFRSGSDGPVHHYGQENYRGGSEGRGSPNYRGGVSSRGGGDGKEHRRPFDSPPRYPLPRSGGDDGFEGELRPVGDGAGGFRPMVGGGSGGEGFRPMGWRSGEGFSPIDGRGGERFRPMGGRSGEGFPPVGGSGGEGFRPMGGSGGEGFRPMGRRSAEGFRPMGGSTGEGFSSMGGSGRGFPPVGGGAEGEFWPMGAGDGERLRPIGAGDRFRPVGSGSGDGGGFGLDNNRVAPVSLTGQKRGYSFSGRERSPDRSDGGSFAKLFVGSVPRTTTEEDIRPLFDKHGRVLEVALIKDKRTGQQQGCCFIKYVTSEEADRAIRALHNQYTLPGGVGPIQVRYADGERERLGATEYKLFVGSLNKQATEKEVEEIFQPYGKVEDVYLMRDEMKQSRGCGFVKYTQRETAQAAINALNGAYTMRGCDQPLTVRFADPKRPRPAESRGPAFGGLGFGPRFSAPGIRPSPDLGEPHLGHIPPNSWRPVSPQNTGPSSSVGIHGFGNQLPARSGDAAVSSTPGAIGGFPGNVDGSLPGPTVSSASMSQLNFNQSLPQIPSFGSKISPGQRPLLSPQHLPSSLQLQPPNIASFTNVNSLQGSHMQLGPMQMPHSAGQTPVSQASLSRPLPASNGQLPVPQPQVKHNASLAPGQAPGLANKQQLPSQQLQPLHQSPSQLAQMLSQQKQTLQATFQSSQQAFNQLQQQVQQLQPSNQNLTSHQGPQATKQQSPWAGIASEPVVNTPGVQQAGDVAPTTTASLAAAALNPAMAAVNCNWTEHTSPDGYKYYYNSSTGESKWEKPEELTQYEQPQRHQKPHSQHSQVHSQSQGLSMQQSPQFQVQFQGQHQAQLNQIQPLQQTSQSSSYQVQGASAKQSTKELGYSQIPGGTGPVNDPARYQQHLHASQEWMWKNKPSGT